MSEEKCGWRLDTGEGRLEQRYLSGLILDYRKNLCSPKQTRLKQTFLIPS